jgi:hypothetical protein
MWGLYDYEVYGIIPSINFTTMETWCFWGNEVSHGFIDNNFRNLLESSHKVLPDW